jgi:acetyl-CoA acetyltransferase
MAEIVALDSAVADLVRDGDSVALEGFTHQARLGLETMCIGGGQGIAAVFERVTP